MLVIGEQGGLLGIADKQSMLESFLKINLTMALSCRWNQKSVMSFTDSSCLMTSRAFYLCHSLNGHGTPNLLEVVGMQK